MSGVPLQVRSRVRHGVLNGALRICREVFGALDASETRAAQRIRVQPCFRELGAGGSNSLSKHGQKKGKARRPAVGGKPPAGVRWGDGEGSDDTASCTGSVPVGRPQVRGRRRGRRRGVRRPRPRRGGDCLSCRGVDAALPRLVAGGCYAAWLSADIAPAPASVPAELSPTSTLSGTPALRSRKLRRVAIRSVTSIVLPSTTSYSLAPR